MASTTFTDGVTKIVAAWLNDVNVATYTTIPAIQTHLNGVDTHLTAIDGRLTAIEANGWVTDIRVTDVAWGKITGTPTTIAGYGITDVGNRVAQVVTYQTGAVATGTTTVNITGIPTNVMGDQYLAVTLTPTNAASTLVIQVTIFISNSASNSLVACLFQDATANALAGVLCYQALGTGFNTLTFHHVMPAGTTSATTFKVRGGGSVAGTTTFNGSVGAQYLGGVAASRITVTEYLP